MNVTRKNKVSVDAAREEVTRAFTDAKPSKTLGDLLWWDFASGFNRPAADVVQAWTDAGLDPSIDLPNTPDAGTAFSRAVTKAKRAAGAFDCRIEDCLTPDGTRRVAVVQLVRSTDVKGATVGVVTLDALGAVTVEQHDKHGIAAQLSAGVGQFAGRYTIDDVRTGITAVLDRWHATPCRQAPPHIVYWLPAPGGETIRKVRNVVAALGAGKLHLCPMGKNDDAKEAASSAANGGLSAELLAFSREVETWRTTPPSTAGTIERRVAAAEALRAKGQLYRTILGDAVDDIDGSITALQNDMRRALGCLEAAE